MSDGSRRGAIYVHRSDMESLKSSSSKPTENLAPRGSITKANSSGGVSGDVSAKDFNERKCRSTTPSKPVIAGHRGQMPRHGGGGRRASMATGATATGTLRRQSLLQNFGGDHAHNGRRLSCFPSDSANNRRGSTAHHSQPAKPKKLPEPEPALTREQVEAFQEVFDLFDSNGGGTIDADELQSALSSVDIHLPAQDIRDVLEGIDKDGSGEIDFEEFLTLMTNTEKYLETFASENDGEVVGVEDPVGGREIVLFDALTKFMKTSALKQMDVLERYFNTKYKRAQAPHVVMHYAAGARLIGLTEKQLVQHLDSLQASNAGYDYQSPYAEPLRIMLAPKVKVRKKKKKKKITKKKSGEDIERPRLTGKIKIRVLFHSENDANPPVEENKVENNENTDPVVESDTKKEKIVRPLRLGWIQPRAKGIADRLPIMKRPYTMDNLADMREKIQVAVNGFRQDAAHSLQEDNRRYWKSLQCHRMNPTQRSTFRRIFHTYADSGRPPTKC